MDKLEAGIAVLVGVGAMDGDFADEEKKQMVSFTDKCLKGGWTQADLDRAFQNISDAMDKGTFFQKFEDAVTYFRNSESIEMRVGMLDFMLAMILSDQTIHALEEENFWIICDFWEIDRAKYIERVEELCK